jgi:hypothetical protein
MAGALRSRVILPPECFFPMLAQQVANFTPEIKGGVFRLPDEANLASLVDRAAVKRYAI